MATQTSRGPELRTETLGGLHWAAIGAAAVTAVIHLFLGVTGLLGGGPIGPGLGASFLLAGLGFVGAIALVLVDYRRRLLYAVGIPFTGIQIVLWYYLNYAVGPRSLPQIGPIDAVDKLAQVVLIALLVVLYRRE
jgi:hypothetical protein